MSVPSTALPLAQTPAIGNTYGAILLGTFLGLILYGVTLHQTYRYVRRTNLTDCLFTRSLVYFIVAFDTIYTILSMHMSYWYLVSNYFRPDRLFTGIWSIDLIPIATAIGIVSSQAFFAHRVYLVGRRLRPLVALTCIMFLAELGLAIMATVKAFVLPNLADFSDYAWTNSACFGIIVVADLMLTSVLIRVLHQSRTGFRRTDSVIDVLIAYAVTTGLVTDILSLVCLVLALIGPNNLIYASCDIVCTKVYVNCVLATLNSRKSDASPSPAEDHCRPRAVQLATLSSSEDATTTVERSDFVPCEADNARWATEVLHIKPMPVDACAPDSLHVSIV